MKLWLAFLLSVSILFGVIYFDVAYGGPARIDLDDVTVCVGTKTPVMVGGWEPSRHYYAVGNWSPTYVVFHATWPIGQADIQGLTSLAIGALRSGSGIPLAPYTDSGSDLNKWEDQYRIWYSSWYVLLSSNAAPADTAPISARVTYRQKK